MAKPRIKSINVLVNNSGSGSLLDQDRSCSFAVSYGINSHGVRGLVPQPAPPASFLRRLVLMAVIPLDLRE
jgi:hypothetical protein